MNIIQAQRIPPHLEIVVVLARLLERLERSPAGVSPAQYRDVAERLRQALEAAPADAALQAVLDAFPAAAELYENLHYRHAGLCRTPLEPALAAELLAREVIGRAARRSGRPPH
ncbi:hypothetical protein [Caldimonas tepidiphila]|uniref:hypothetical protein n=1 Tax=Caldimonas tepidiphila TaxID=2315841 RepID=UPI000E5B0334|nr:hypothetical protein [Caldimonas tepidiphila]